MARLQYKHRAFGNVPGAGVETLPQHMGILYVTVSDTLRRIRKRRGRHPGRLKPVGNGFAMDARPLAWRIRLAPASRKRIAGARVRDARPGKPFRAPEDG